MEIIKVVNKIDVGEKLNNEILLNSFNVYCRVSTKDQIENTSLDNQRDLGVDFCKNNLKGRYKYIIVWSEEGKSSDDLKETDIGDTIGRELLSELMLNVREKTIKNIWVYDLSRLSRNDIVSEMLNRDFRKYGVELYVGNTKYNLDEPMDKMIYQILSSVNEYENQIRFHKSLMGKRRNLNEGKWWGGSHPIGFQNVNNRLIEDTEKSGIVKLIFQWYYEGKTSKYIKDKLELRKVISPIGNLHWNENSIRNIVRNTFYIGYKDYEVCGIKGKSKEYCKERGKLYLHRFKCDSIIDKEMFDSIGKRIENNRRNKGNNKNNFLFKGIIFCESCGVMMRGREIENKGENSYRCVSNENNYRDSRKVKCDSKRSVNRSSLEEIVWIKILEVYKNSEIIKEEYRKNNIPTEFSVENIKKMIKSINDKIKRREGKIKSIENDEVNYMVKKMDRKLSDFQLDRVLKISKELKEKVNNEITTLNLRKDILENNNGWEGWFDSFKLEFNEICKYVGDDKKRKFINNFVEKIWVKWNKENKTHSIKIEFKLNVVKDKGNLIEENIYKIKKGGNEVSINDINVKKISKKLNQKLEDKTHILHYSTVVDCGYMWENDNQNSYNSKYNSLIIKFIIQFDTSKLNRRNHYNEYQKKLFNEVKYLKDELGLGYRRISYLLYEKGYRGIRNNQILKNNDIYSIYKKGKIREDRIDREFPTLINDVIVYEDVL